MLIVGVQGSPNRQGNSAKMIQTALEYAQSKGAQTKLIEVNEILATLDSPFCTDCSKPCKGICLEGTEMEEVLEIMRKADGVICATPVYFGTLSGQTKAFFDKLRCLRGEKALLNTVGAAMSVGHTLYGGEEKSIDAIHDTMLVFGMTLVGDSQAQMGNGHFGAAMNDPVEGNQAGIERIQLLTQRVLEVAEATKSLRS